MKTLAVLLLAACSPYSISGPTTPAITPLGPASADAATICVVRSSPWARAVTFVVHDNKTLVGATRGDSYFCYEAEPGEHVIVSDTFDSTDVPGHTRIVVDAGVRYWLRQDHSSSFGSVTSRLAWIDPATADALIAGASHRRLTAVPGHEHVPPPVPFAPATRPLASR
jgi:hypothetical protein